MLTRTLVVLSILSAVSCIHPRTLYISNKTGEPVTLIVESDSLKKNPSLSVSFRDSINGRHVDPGYTILNFGKGKWEAADKQNLKNVLSETKVIIGSSNKAVALPQTRIKHYGWFVNELIFKIAKPKQ